MNRLTIVAIGLFGVLIGVALILPALAKVEALGAMPGAVVLPYTVGIGLALLGIATTAVGFKRRRAA